MKKRINNHQRSTIKKVMNYIRRYWGYLGMSIVLAAVTVALTLYLPVLTGRAVDLIIEKGVVDFVGILAILKRMAVIILLTAAAQWIMNACNNKITYHIIRDIRKEAFEKIERLPLKYIDGHSYGEIVSRVIADVDQFADGIYPVFHRYCNHFRYVDLHDYDQCENYGGSRCDHTGFAACGKFYRKENIFHV